MTSLEKIESRMTTGPFTYGELCVELGDLQDQGRLADKTIQKWRRRGWIAFERVKGRVVWSLTDLGREQAAKQGQDGRQAPRGYHGA